MREAAALPLISITAWEGLVDRMRISPGSTVLIQGGAGGVGHVAVQLARSFGASVYATGSTESRALIERLGATFIDRHAPIADAVAEHTDGEGFDFVFDTAGGAALDASFVAVREFGHVASALGWGTHALAPLSFKGGSYSGVFTLAPLLTGRRRQAHGAILGRVAALVEAGKLRPELVAEHYDLATVDAAHAAVRLGSTRGKVVVDIIA
ncbi:zinc-binding dehydrogenase [Novosphingobium sp. BL-8H]|uniref:zinc-binding dehydrogenase n=1 Tax=Novosphingobium sp. BL-8H TaxID=3127640 RepID=UPI0037563D30